jgi:hypothetical protein
MAALVGVAYPAVGFLSVTEMLCDTVLRGKRVHD